MKKLLLCSVVLAALATPSVQADSGNWSAGLGVSTLGVGGSVGYRFNDSFKLRGVVNYFKINRKFSDSDDDLSYHSSLRLFTAGLMGDWHVLKNGFRLTAGLVYNGNRFNIKATPTQNVRINGRVYTPAQIGEVNGSLTFRPIAPYIGIGYDSGHESRKGFSFTADLGILFQGSVRGKINSITGQAANDAQAINDMKDDAVKALNGVRLIKTYPVVSLGISYKF